MKTLLRSTVAAALMFVVAPAIVVAEDRILIPAVAHEPVPGAFGSQWVTELAGRNLGPHSVGILFPICPDSISCSYLEIAPDGWFNAGVLTTVRSPHGAVLRTVSGQASSLAVTARVRDLSRGHLTWGTEIPIARERDLTDTPITLFNVPNAERFRLTLRMYDFQMGPINSFVITAFALNGSVPLAEIRVPMSPLVDADDVDQGLYFAVLTDLMLPADAPDRLRLTVRTEIPTKFWAFVSVTNNETQHVTVISPTRLSN